MKKEEEKIPILFVWICNIKLLFLPPKECKKSMASNKPRHTSRNDENIKARQRNDRNNNDHGISSRRSKVLEQGDIFFFYRPKAAAQEVKGIDDVRRFFMITAPYNSADQRELYRLFVIGKKSLPEIRTTEARRSERYWAKVGGMFYNAEDLTRELLADEYAKGDAARPVGEGKYAIVKHQDHAELVYLLEMPREPGQAQEELGIEKEASYIISVINPKIPVPKGYPSAEEPPQYPESILKEFGEGENFVSLARDLNLINYQNAQIILIGSREGNNLIREEMGIDIREEEETIHSADIFSRLHVEKGRVPIKPLSEGKFE